MVILVDELLLQVHLRCGIDISVLVLCDLFHGKLIKYFHFSLASRWCDIFLVVLSQLILVIRLISFVLDYTIACLANLDVVDSAVSPVPDDIAVSQVVFILVNDWTFLVCLFDEVEGAVKVLWVGTLYV